MEKRFGEETDQEPVYVTGHVHPDTDSVASAIAYAFYKKEHRGSGRSHAVWVR